MCIRDRNKPQAALETIPKREAQSNVEPIPWRDWLGQYLQNAYLDNAMAKGAFQHACMWVHTHQAWILTYNLATGEEIDIHTGSPYPVSMQKDQGVIKVVAEQPMAKGRLAIPVFCMRGSNYIALPCDSRHRRAYHEVIGKVKYAGDEVEIQIACQPERRQPAARDNMKDSDYDDSTDCHPFWHIRRSNVVGEFNSAVKDVLVTMIGSAPNEELKIGENTPKALSKKAVEIWVPFIVNTEDIASAGEIVLKLEKAKAEAKKTDGTKRVITAFTQNDPRKKMKR